MPAVPIAGVKQFRVNTYTNSVTAVVWFFLEVSNDGGVSWVRVNLGGDSNWAATNGWVAAQTQAPVVAAMNAAHAREITNLDTTANGALWTTGPIVAGPV